MKSINRTFFIALTCILAFFLSTVALHADKYITSADNENNAHTGTADNDMALTSPPCIFNTDANHPIEFNINVTGALPTQSAYLAIFIEDVDWPNEYDEVFLNGHSLGPVIGQDELDYSTLFVIPDLSWVLSGNNLIEIRVDQLNVEYWCARVRYGQLIIDEGLGIGPAYFRTATADASQYNFGAAVAINLEVDTPSANQTVRLELILRDPNGIVQDFDTKAAALNWPIVGTADEPYSWNFTLPGSGTSGLWSVTIGVYDVTTLQFQATRTITFAVPAGNYPPVINSVTPSSGPYGSSQAVTVVGQNFIQGNTTLTIGGIALANLLVVNTNTITGNVSPTLPSGQHAASCTTSYGTGSLANAYTVGASSNFDLTIVAGPGGITSPFPGVHSIGANSSVLIRAIPHNGYRFNGWMGDAPAGHGQDNPITLVMDANKSVEALFLQQFTLNISVPTGGGSTLPAVGTHVFDRGMVVNLNAIPDPHFEFIGWGGDVPAGDILKNPLSIVMTIDKIIEAKFQRIIYAPAAVQGKKVLNRSLSQAEYINVIQWQPSADNVDISKYRVYLVEGETRTLAGEVNAQATECMIRNVAKDKTYTYELVAVNKDNREGNPAPVTIQ